jgi:hypothetical protein
LVVRHLRNAAFGPSRTPARWAATRSASAAASGSRRLKPGLYRLIALPVDAAGNTGNAVFIKFRIVR